MEEEFTSSRQKELVSRARRFITQLGRVYDINILSKSRKKEVIVARQPLMAIMKKELNLTLALTGEIFMRNHATIIHSIKQVETAQLLKDPVSLKMQENYYKFLPHVQDFRRQLENKRTSTEQLIWENTTSIEEKIEQMERKMSEQMRLFAKTIEQKAELKKQSDTHKTESEKYKEKYLALKLKYGRIATGDDMKELERMTSYL